MLSIALTDENFILAARIRDTRTQLLHKDPTHILRHAMEQAVANEDFLTAARVRDEVERREMLAVAESAKPKYPPGLVVYHRRLNYRMLIFGVDYRCRSPRRKGDDCGLCLIQRAEEQPFYHVAVDERDKKGGDNILYVAEDDCIPAEAEGVVEVLHPIVAIMFGEASQVPRKGGCVFTWYAPGAGD